MIPQQPNTILSPLGYSSDTRNIPATTPAGTNQLSFESGFPLLTSTPIQAGGIPPERQDFNAAFKLLSEFAYYIQSGNHFTWSSQLDYNAGAFVIGSDNAVYFCIQANGATSPNTVQDPTSSTDYWVQIITSSGQINASALSVTLGSFAQLNSLALTDNRLTGILPVANGGTGTKNDFEWKNSYSDTEFNTKIGLSYPFTTQELVTAIINTFNGKLIFCMVAGWRRDENVITDFPGSNLTHRTIINMSDLNQFYLETVDPFNLTTYICNVSGGVAGPWIQIRNADGTLPTNVFANDSIPAAAIQSLATVATSGSYNDLTNKPTIPTNVAPLPIPIIVSGGVGTWRAFGSMVSPDAFLPQGGTWAYVMLTVNADGTIPIGSAIGSNFFASVAEGGSRITGNSTGAKALGFCWRIQ